MFHAQKLYTMPRLPMSKKLLTQHRQAEWDDFASSLSFKYKSIYKLNYRLLHKTLPTYLMKSPNGTKLYDKLSKAESFANFMETQ